MYKINQRSRCFQVSFCCFLFCINLLLFSFLYQLVIIFFFILTCYYCYIIFSKFRKGTRKNFVLDQSSTSHMQLEYDFQWLKIILNNLIVFFRSLEYKPSDEGETGTSDGDDNSLAEIKNLGDYREIFIARRECKNQLLIQQRVIIIEIWLFKCMNFYFIFYFDFSVSYPT